MSATAPVSTAAVAKVLVRSVVGVLVFAGFIFIGAGTFHVPSAWRYVGLAVFGALLNHALLWGRWELLVERDANVAAGEPWDKALLRNAFLANLVMFVLAGVDLGRLRWTGEVPAAAPLVGAGIMVVGQVVFALAKRQNAFFSSTVRIQTERGHVVCDDGLYARVRHPGYLGMLLMLGAFPLVLGSWLAAVPCVVGLALLLLRTAKEDRFLQGALDGYAAYATRVRWRLLPGVY